MLCWYTYFIYSGVQNKYCHYTPLQPSSHVFSGSSKLLQSDERVMANVNIKYIFCFSCLPAALRASARCLTKARRGQLARASSMDANSQRSAEQKWSIYEHSSSPLSTRQTRMSSHQTSLREIGANPLPRVQL